MSTYYFQLDSNSISVINRSEALVQKIIWYWPKPYCPEVLMIKGLVVQGLVGGWVQGAPRMDKASLTKRKGKNSRLKEWSFCAVSAQLQLGDDLSCLLIPQVGSCDVGMLSSAAGCNSQIPGSQVTTLAFVTLETSHNYAMGSLNFNFPQRLKWKSFLPFVFLFILCMSSIQIPFIAYWIASLFFFLKNCIFNF